MDSLLVKLAGSLEDVQSLEDLVRPLLDLLETISGLESTYLTRIDLEAGMQEILYARNSSDLVIPEHLSVPWNDTLCKRALEEGRYVTSDVPACWGDSEAAKSLGLQTYVSTPVRAKGGALFGTLCGASAARLEIPADVERVLAGFAKLISYQVEREQNLHDLSQAYAALSAAALSDPGTNLPNRRAVLDELARAIPRSRRDQSGLLVAFIDLDRFKAINDTHGHEAGDRFLELVGARLSAALRASDMVGRFGGDEFVVIAPVQAEAPDEAIEILTKRLEAATQGSFDVGGQVIDYVGASVGVVALDSEATVQSVIAAADAAMYRAKSVRQADRYERAGERTPAY